VTVCIAALFQWNFAKPGDEPDFGKVAVTISDRMFTTPDFQYEPELAKVGRLSPKTIVLVAGDLSIHSEAIKNVTSKITPLALPENIAVIYGREIQAIKRRHAEDIFLAPLGLNTDIFTAQQREMAPQFVDTITNQLQSYRGEDVEALIVGADDRHAQIWYVDARGVAICCNDLGFAAIGVGAWHAKSRLMQVGYRNTLDLNQSLAAVLAAKRSAEVAPGVGKHSDINLVSRFDVNPLRVEIVAGLNEIYDEFEREQLALAQRMVAKVPGLINVYFQNSGQPNAETTGIVGGDAQVDEGAGPNAAEAPPGIESGKTEG
jgi:hypothetical protein